MQQQSTTKGFAILSAAGLAVKFLSLVYFPILLHILGDVGYGLYASAYAVYILMYAITNSGSAVALSKFVSELVAVGNVYDAERSFRISRAAFLAVGIIMSCLMIAVAKPVVIASVSEPAYLAILALSPTLVFTALASAYRGYFQGQGNMYPTAMSQIIEQIINAIFTVVFAALLLRYGIAAACAGGTIGTSLGALCSCVFLAFYHKRHPHINQPDDVPKPTVKRRSYKYLISKIVFYSFPITAAISLQYAGNLVDMANCKLRLISAGFSENAATTMYGYLTKYQQLFNVPIAVIAALCAAIVPAIAGAVAAKNKVQIEDRVNYAFRLCFLIALPSAFAFCVMSEQLYSMIFWGQASFVMKYGAFALVFMAVMQIQTSALQSMSKMYRVVPNLVCGIITKIVVNYIFIAIPQINILGAIIGSMSGFLVSIVLNARLINKQMGIKTGLFRQCAKPLLSSIIMAISIYLVYNLFSHALFFVKSDYALNAISLIFASVAGGIAYIVTLVYTRCLQKSDFLVLPERVRGFIPKWVMSMAR